MTVQEDPRAAARRIVEEVLADHAARSATPAAPTPVERTSTVPPPPQAIPAAPIAATSHPDTVAWRTARRIVDEVLAAHASAPPGDTLVADPPNVVADGSAPIDSLEVPTLLIDVSDQSTEVAVVSEAASPLPTDGIPEELFAGHIIVSEADGDEPTATAPTVEPPAEPEVEPVPDDPDPVPVDPDPVPVDPDPVPVDPDPVPVDPEPEPLEPQPVPIDSDVGKARAVAPDATARPFSTEAASVASRIVAEVLADHAERDAATAEAQAAGTTAQLPTATQEVPARHEAPEPDGPPPIPAVAGPTLPADPAAVGAVLTDAPPPLADEVETRDATLDLDEVPGPRRTGRWLMTTIVGAVALALLFPLAVRALRELISLG